VIEKITKEKNTTQNKLKIKDLGYVETVDNPFFAFRR
jgi:hypothetical protein